MRPNCPRSRVRPSPGPIRGCSTTEISTLYVQPRHHGKGIGKGLLNEGLRKCATDGVPLL
ncbi:GNAT family N-acetyltransferase [Sinorhizobium numidicum]|uniref:GNAT family N-acetyltransferase n=1 Tax=Sinorhizobium numidicum TaxID=680248 RepID=UPI003CC85893